MSKIKSVKAIALQLGELDQPAITGYDLGKILVSLCATKVFAGEQIDIRTNFPNRVYYIKQLDELLDSGILTRHKDFPGKNIFFIIGKKGFDAGDIACSIDPFAYVSHLSAMSFHGITDRVPSSLIISSPSQNAWRGFALKKMRTDLGTLEIDYKLNKLPLLSKPIFNKIDKTPAVSISSGHLGAFKHVRGRSVRVATIGRTFLDMTRRPEACGGMRHVIDVFEEYGEKYKNLIIDEVGRHGTKIEKARTGYLLESVANIKDDRLEQWLDAVQRGGSRKLDPAGEYSPNYSERWCISINTD